MFDKLVESSSTGAELGPRRRIFAATLVLVTVLFATAVVASIYAADFDLGTSNFDIAELLTPVTQTEPPPEPEQPRPERNSNLPQSANNEIVRPVLMASTDDFTKVPDKTSAEVNPYASIPIGKYERVTIGAVAADPGGQGDGPIGPGTGSNPGLATGSTNDLEEKSPPPAAPKPEKKNTIVSGGAMAGKATHLPKPVYSAAAKAVGAQGSVSVQILVDETGKVISAKAASGNPFLRPAAVEAAWKAKFNPATLSGVPVKVTGIITYNFIR
jgi:protein TonB